MVADVPGKRLRDIPFSRTIRILSVLAARVLSQRLAVFRGTIIYFGSGMLVRGGEGRLAGGEMRDGVFELGDAEVGGLEGRRMIEVGSCEIKSACSVLLWRTGKAISATSAETGTD